jgi:hypothetical protein
MLYVKLTLPEASVVFEVSVRVPTENLRLSFGFQPGPEVIVTTVPRGPVFGEIVSVAGNVMALDNDIPLPSPVA